MPQQQPSRAPHSDRLHISIDGMSCAGCASAAERALLDVPGVAAAEVNFALASAEVTADAGSAADPALAGKLASALRDAGYQLRGQHVQLQVDGMSCAGCASGAEKLLRRQPGVLQAEVNFALKRADLQLAEADADLAPLLAELDAAGFPSQPLRTASTENDADGSGADASADDDPARSERRQLLIAALLTAPLVLQMLGMALGLDWHLAPWMEFLLATPVQFWIGARFYRGAWQALRHRRGNMDLLVALGTSAAWGFSTAQMLLLGAAASGQLYFEGAAVVITLVLAGKWLESRAVRGATAAVRELMALRPQRASRLRDDGSEETVAIAEVRPGDRLRVRPGEKVPVDGEILSGRSELDESLLSGESLPVARGPGDSATGGAINGSGALELRATAVGADSTLGRIIALVEQAQAGKAPIQRLVDRIAAVFVPAVVAIAALTFVGWLLAGGGFEQALIAAVSVLVIACPCALGLATPAALVSGTGSAARAGILIKDIRALERAARIDGVIFDKTGTLTAGRPALVAQEAFGDGDDDGLLSAVAGLQQGSEHPLARAVLRAASERGLAPGELSDFRSQPGEGAAGCVDGRRVAIGNAAMMQREAVDVTALRDAWQRLSSEGRSAVYVAVDGAPAGVLAFADPLRAESAEAVRQLRRRGIASGMLSGDSEAAAAHIAAQLGLDDYAAGVRPEGKAGEIARRQAGGQYLAMVGDGVNDAPALAAAELGIAVGSGSDVALETADVALLRNDPRLVPAALDIALRTRAVIRQNLFWAFIYNLIGLPLAAAGLLSPAFAGAAMALSSLSVVGNALRLRRWRPPLQSSPTTAGAGRGDGAESAAGETA